MVYGFHISVPEFVAVGIFPAASLWADIKGGGNCGIMEQRILPSDRIAFAAALRPVV